MPIKKFPDPRNSSPEGIIALGGDLHPDSLLLAYRNGIFPWPIEGLPLAWFCPPERAILDFKDLTLPRSLARAWRKNQASAVMNFTFDRDFEAVISACATVPRPEKGTWITSELKSAYIEFHRAGYAHSVESRSPDGTLIGGIYGVEVDGVFSAESMFYHKPYASKFALLTLIEHLQKARGLQWMDIQMLTPHMVALGAKELARSEFLKLLKRTQKAQVRSKTSLFWV